MRGLFIGQRPTIMQILLEAYTQELGMTIRDARAAILADVPDRRLEIYLRWSREEQGREEIIMSIVRGQLD